MDKQMAPLNKESARDWLAKLSSTAGLSKEHTIALIQECVNNDEFGALPNEVQMASVDEVVEIYLAVIKLYHPYENVLGKMYSEKQKSSERPEKFLAWKRLLN